MGGLGFPFLFRKQTVCLLQTTWFVCLGQTVCLPQMDHLFRWGE